jgi:hypothetical protein
MSNGGVPREARSPLIFAAAAANAWLRGLSIPRVALHYRYEPLTALLLIWRFRRDYGAVHVGRFVPAGVLKKAGELFGRQDEV